jgi:hypothetical protein
MNSLVRWALTVCTAVVLAISLGAGVALAGCAGVRAAADSDGALVCLLMREHASGSCVYGCSCSGSCSDLYAQISIEVVL